MRYIISILLINITLISFGQIDKPRFCNQYDKAINYIRQDSFIKSTFLVKICNFNVSKELTLVGIHPDFDEEFMVYIFKKPYDSISKSQKDSTYTEFLNDTDPFIGSYKINCPKSDKNYNLDISFSRTNDSIIGVTVYKIHNASFYEKAKKNEKKGTITFDIGALYLFFFDREDNIIYIIKKTAYRLI